MSTTATLNSHAARSVTAAGTPVLLVFSDDWGRHPSSCQHLIGHLLDDFQVIWVNTIGMRPPRWNWSTVTRGWEKIRGWSKPQPAEAELHQNLTIANPMMWPWVKRRLDRSINRKLLVRQLKGELSSVDAPVIGITTIPIVADVMDRLPVDRWVYYCVDDFSCWPGLEQQSLGEMEDIVLEKADVVIAAGSHLQQRHSRKGGAVHLLRHGIDLEHWTTRGNGSTAIPLSSEPGPRITFWGLIDRRMDVSFIEELSSRLEAGSIHLVGPQDNPPPQLTAIKNVRLHPPVSYEQLPAWAARSDVLIMPYADAPVTRAMQPLKLLEYLATGLPVIARDLPANREWTNCLDLAADPQKFADAVLERLKTGLPSKQLSARERLKPESWRNKANQFRDLLLDRTFDRCMPASVLRTSRQRLQE